MIIFHDTKQLAAAIKRAEKSHKAAAMAVRSGRERDEHHRKWVEFYAEYMLADVNNHSLADEIICHSR